jgi:signal transduction histidine kinase
MYADYSDQSSTNTSNFSCDVPGSNKAKVPVTPLVNEITHDLNNLVTDFKMRLYLAQKVPIQLPEYLTSLEHLVNHLDALVHELVTASQPDVSAPVNKLKPINLNDLVKRVIETYEPIAFCKGLSLFFDAASHLSPILANDLEMNRVVANLVGNAVNYTPAGGSVSLTTSQESSRLLLTIHDTGIGISSESLPHIFDRFYRSNEAQSRTAGSGLGLAIVQGIVKKYGGNIEVESVLGKGSTFKVLFPAVL